MAPPPPQQQQQQQQVDLNEYNGWHIYVGTIVTIIPATLAVAARFIARYISSAGYWWDDWTVLISLFVNWAMAAIRWAEILHWDYGYHAERVPNWKVQAFQKSFIAVQATYFSNAVITKTSIILLYYRIFAPVQWFRKTLWVAAAIVWAYFLACLPASIAGCHPVSYFWDRRQSGSCIDLVNFFRWNGITNLLLDVMVLVLPLPMVWQLKVDLRQKAILSGIFLLGAFVCLTSIFRIIAFNDSNPKDPTYTTIDTAMWSSIEQSVAIACACLPTLRPLFRRLWGHYNSTHQRTTPSHHSYALNSINKTNPLPYGHRTTVSAGSNNAIFTHPKSKSANNANIQVTEWSGHPAGWRISDDTGDTVVLSDSASTEHLKPSNLNAFRGTVSAKAEAGGGARDNDLEQGRHEGHRDEIVVKKEITQRMDRRG